MSRTGHLPELDSLRAQVAALSRELAERDRLPHQQNPHLDHTMQGRRAQPALLQAILEATAAETGDEFFAALATHLTSALNVQYAFIGEIVGDVTKKIRTVACAAGGDLTDNFEYEWEPRCHETGMEQAFGCFEQGAQAAFPHVRQIAGLGVESYCGVPLRTKAGLDIGLLVLMDTKPLSNGESLKSLLGVVAPRAAAELQRTRALKALREHNRRLVKAQAQAHLGSWAWDIAGGEVEWSDEQFRIFGHTPQCMTVNYDTFLASLIPDDQDRVLAAINDALTGKAPYDVECGIVRPNGEVRFIHCRGEVIRNEAGHPVAMGGTCLDITDRKRVEESLKASEERWQLTLRGSPDGIWDWNIRTGEVFFSTRWKALRGYEDHEVTNSLDEWRSRIHPDDLERVLQRLDAYVAKQCSEFCEEYRVQRKDGSYVWILDRGVVLWDAQGTPLRLVGSESEIFEKSLSQTQE